MEDTSQVSPAPDAAPSESVHPSRLVLEGRADVDRSRHRAVWRRLTRAILFVGAIDGYLLWRILHGDAAIPGLPPDWQYWMPQVLIMVILGGLAVVMIMPMMSGRSPDRLVRPEEIEVGLDQVVGLDSQVDDVMRTLDVFLAYKTFRERLGGNPRRGVLFEGPPGTGKTYLAKAMAKQAGVPFLFASSSQFQNVFFGMTNVRIRKFFKKLRKAARREGGAIGFIEEIDSIAENRGQVSGFALAKAEGRSVSSFMPSSGASGIVNELLVQMQSFDEPGQLQRLWGRLAGLVNGYLPVEWRIKAGGPVYHNILVVAATNRADSLDPALLRPGRFDRRIYFDLPGKRARRDLIDFFLAGKSHGPELDEETTRERLAHDSLAYTPAMLENLFDEALVSAIRHGREAMNLADVYEAKLGQELGLKQPVVYTEHEREMIATHEAGHAAIAHLLGMAQRLEVLSIIKRQSSLGLLARTDTEERFMRSRSELESGIAIALGGMAAEEIYFGESTTGPGSDLAAATTLAATMVGALGMGGSLLSFLAVTDGVVSQTNLVGKVLADADAKREADGLLNAQKVRVLEVLGANRDVVEALRDALIARDELIGDEITMVIWDAIRRRHVVVLPESDPVAGPVSGPLPTDP